MGYVSEIENIKKIENELSNSNNPEKDIFQKSHQGEGQQNNRCFTIEIEWPIDETDFPKKI